MENSSKISHLLRTLTFLLITFFTHPTFTKAQNAVGSVNGALTINDMGAAVYSVTFDAPNGGRMTPKIGLAYSSQSSGYGLAGYGIDVTGISVITSGGRDMFHNGKVRGANYDKDSNFYLDGKRLILQEGEDGEDGTLYAPEGDPYTKVTLHGDINSGTAYFEVTATDGTVFTYGSGNNSRLQVAKGGSTRTAAWYVTTAVNRYGESINYAYHNENLCVSPQTITYGTDRGLTAKVEFSYRDMAGANVRTYRIGSQQGMRNKLLSSVTTSINGQTYRKYDFAYDETAGDKFSRLTTITESNGAGESLNPTELTWNTSSSVEVTHTDVTGIQTKSNDAFGVDEGDNSYTAIDLNGDGIADVIRMCPGKIKIENNNWAICNFVYVYPGKKNPVGHTEYQSPIKFTLPCYPNEGKNSLHYTAGAMSAMDYDGDGYNDIVFTIYGNSEYAKKAQLHFLSGKRVHDGVGGSLSVFTLPIEHGDESPLAASMDVNGDGRDELILLERGTDNGLYRLLALRGKDIDTEENILKSTYAKYLALPSAPQKVFTGDYNGDGLTDLFVSCVDGYVIYYNCGYSQAQVQLTDVFSDDNCTTGSDIKDFWRMEQGDFNGDGLADFFCHDSDTRLFSIAYYNGDGTFRKQTFADNWGVYDDSGTDKDNNKFSVIVTDFDNDGKSDVVMSKAMYDFYHESFWRSSSYEYNKTLIRWLHSTGDGLELTRAYEFNGEDQSAVSRIVASDLDGDGKIEFASMGFLLDASNSIDDESTMHIYKAGTADASDGRLKTVADGFGNVTELKYAYATDKSVYAQSDEPLIQREYTDRYIYNKLVREVKSETVIDAYPVNRYTLPIALVSSIKSAGTDVSYGYKDLRLHIAGRGMMGFGTTTKTDNIHGVTESKEVTKWDTKYWLPTESTLTNTILSTGEESSIRSEYVIRNQGVSYNSVNVYTDYDGNQRFEKTYTDSDSGMPSEITKGDGDGNMTTMIATEQFPEYEQINGIWLPRHKDVEMFREEDGNSSIYYEDYTYDSQANMTRKVITGMKLDDAKWDFEDGSSIETDYTYDRWGNVTSETFHGNDESTGYKYYEYDPTGRFLVKTYTVPESTTTTYTYDVFGNVLTETDETNASNPLTTMHEYDSWGRRIASYYPDGTGSAYEMGWSSIGGAGGYYTKESHTAAPWVRKYYDSRGREIKTETVGAKGISIIKMTAYNDKGQVATITNKYGQRTSTESFQYDARGRVISDRHSSGAGCTYEYGKNTVSTTDAKGRTVTKTYNVFGDLLQVTDPIGGKVEYKYYSNGKPMEITSGNATVYMEYDEFNRRTKLVDPDAGTVTTTYGKNGQVSSETDGRGVKTTYTYDALGRVTQRKREGVADRWGYKATNTTTYTYGTSGNAKGRVIEKSSNGNNIKYEYDNYGRVVKETRPNTFCHCGHKHDLCRSYKYNALGQLESVTYPTIHYNEGLTVDYRYDSYGYKKAASCDGKSLWSMSTISANKTGMNDITYSTTFGWRYTTYDNDGYPTRQYYKKDGIKDDIYYTWDKLTGNLTSRTINGVTENFTYDELDRLVEVDGISPLTMTYANNGNIQSRSDIGSYTYNPADRPHAVCEVDNANGTISNDVVGTSFDPNGKLGHVISCNNTKFQSFTYGPDDDKWRSNVIDPDDPENNYWDIDVTYWGNYECVMKDFHFREYYFLDNDVIVIRDSNDDDGSEYSWIEHPATLSYYQAVTDHLGSIIAVYDKSQRKVFEASYDAWGKQTVTLDEIDLHHGYTGHEMLFRSGLIHMDGRVYDPAIGRFLSPDNYVATEDLQGFNRYSYCLNNPLRYVDPDGNFPWLIPVIAGIINMVATWDECSGFFSHLVSFGVGAGSTAIGMYGTTAAIVGSGALLGAGNYTNGTIFSGGDFAFEGFLKSGIIGASSAIIGSVVGAAISPLTDKVAGGISNKIVSRAVSNAVGGAATGGALGAAFSFNDPETSWLEGALNGMRDGALVGAVTGAAQGYYEYRQERAAMRLQNALNGDLERGKATFGNDQMTAIRNTVNDILKSENFPQGNGTNSVYVGLDDENVIRYVGITQREPEMRFSEHWNSGTVRSSLRYYTIDGTGQLSRVQARIIEQQLINKFGFYRYNGSLFNKINSISPRKWGRYGIK